MELFYRPPTIHTLFHPPTHSLNQSINQSSCLHQVHVRLGKRGRSAHHPPLFLLSPSPPPSHNYSLEGEIYKRHTCTLLYCVSHHTLEPPGKRGGRGELCCAPSPFPSLVWTRRSRRACACAHAQGKSLFFLFLSHPRIQEKESLPALSSCPSRRAGRWGKRKEGKVWCFSPLLFCVAQHALSCPLPSPSPPGKSFPSPDEQGHVYVCIYVGLSHLSASKLLNVMQP